MKRTKILVIIPTIDKKKKAKESYFNEKKWQEVVKSAATENIVLEKSIFGNASKSLLLNETSFSSLLNIGFTGAVNSTLLAAYQEDYDWFFVLNDDAVLRADFFEKLKPFLTKKKYDVVSCGVEDLSGNPESFGLSYHKSGLAFPITNPAKINNQYFCGTAFLISKDCVQRHIKQDGYFFHPLYFAYAEDLEVSLRMNKNGEKIFVYPEALVIHQGSQTAKRGSEFQLFQGYRNFLLTIFLHWSVQKIILNLPWLIGGQLYGLLITFKNQQWRVYPRILWYFMKNFQSLLLERAKYHPRPPIHNTKWNITAIS